jgi:tetratricopeptide (TPR) repeat protein
MAASIGYGLATGLLLCFVGMFFGGVSTTLTWAFRGSVIVGSGIAVLTVTASGWRAYRIFRFESRNAEALKLLEGGQLEQALHLAQENYERAQWELGPMSPIPIRSLGIQAQVLRRKGNYQAALTKQKWALEMVRDVPLAWQGGLLAALLRDLGLLYVEVGEYEPALHLLQRGVEETRKLTGEHHPEFAKSLGNLADLYQATGAYAAALPLRRQALEVYRAALGEGHPDFAQSLDGLAGLYRATGNYAAALPLRCQALEIRRNALGNAHPHFAQSLNNLALLYQTIGDHAAALPLLRQALEVFRAALGEAHPNFAASLNNLAVVYLERGDYAAALPLLRQGLEVRRAALG